MSAEQVPSQPPVSQKHKRSRKRKGRRRSVPQRTCVGCRTVHPKRDLVRVVRTPDGTVEIDPSGKRSGRGAYLCQQKGCWERALKRRSLEHALKITLDDGTKGVLAAFAEILSKQPKAVPQSEKITKASGKENI